MEVNVQPGSRERRPERLLRKTIRRARMLRSSSDIPSYGLIVGAMKSGTSSLFSLLAQHPQVCPSRWKEPEFFSRPPLWSDAGRTYPELWRFDSRRHTCAVEASTGYSKFPQPPGWAAEGNPVLHVPKEIAAYAESTGASIRIVYIMRDPVERAESQLAHQVAKGRVDPSNVPDEQLRHALYVSRYATQLDRFAEAFEPRQMLLLDLEDLKGEGGSRALLNRCRDFLELDEFEFALAPPENTRAEIGGPARVLDERQREAMREELLPEVRRLRADYGFDPGRWRHFGDT